MKIGLAGLMNVKKYEDDLLNSFSTECSLRAARSLRYAGSWLLTDPAIAYSHEDTW